MQSSEGHVRTESGAAQSFLLGGVLAIDVIGHCLAMATIFFSGGLAAGLGIATAVFLASSVLITLVLFRFSSFRPALGIAQDTSVAILAPAVAAAALGVTGTIEAKVATAFAAIGLATALSGLAFWLAGRLQLGSLLRMFPYPVAAGFLASSGFILIFAGFTILTGASGYTGIVDRLAEPHILWSVIAAVSMAFMLLAVMRLKAGITLVIVVLFAFLAGFYAAIDFLGLDRASAVALGLLPEQGSAGGLRPGPWLYTEIHWGQVATVSLTFLAVMLLNLIAVLLNTSGVEIATRQAVDENAELQKTGLANLVIGAFGGTACFLQSGATIIASRLKLRAGSVISGHIALLLIACFFAQQIVAVVPVFVAAGLLVFIGLSMVEDWLLATRKRMVARDWMIVLGILALTASVGILMAIAAGLGLAILTFVAGFLRLPVIRSVQSAASRRSILDRSPTEAAELSRHGGRVQILQLQGALFFGSVEQIIGAVQKMPADTAALIVDFSEVSSYDSSACAAMQKLGNIMQTRGIAVHLTSMSDQLQTVFARWGLDLARQFRAWPDLDAALEFCETDLLKTLGVSGESSLAEGGLAALGGHHPRIQELLALTEVLELATGEALFRAGSQGGDVYFLESGRLGVYLPGAEGEALLVRAMGPGAVVGEMAGLLGQARVADVVAQAPSRIRRLAADAMTRIETSDRDLAALLSRILAQSLALKVVQSNALLGRAKQGRS